MCLCELALMLFLNVCFFHYFFLWQTSHAGQVAQFLSGWRYGILTPTAAELPADPMMTAWSSWMLLFASKV